jgi:hypothetical protein
LNIERKIMIEFIDCPNCGHSTLVSRGEIRAHERYGVAICDVIGQCQECRTHFEAKLIDGGEGWYLHQWRKCIPVLRFEKWQTVNRIDMPVAAVIVGPGGEYDTALNI